MARKERPDLVVLDVLLPDLMGFDVAEALKRLRIPFIFMSGVHKGGKASANAMGRYGALAYFEKPFERSALLEAVAQVVPPPQGAAPEKPAWDVEAGPQVAEAAEAMQLTGRIDLIGQQVAGKTGPVQLKPMDREQSQRLRVDSRPSPPVMAPRVPAASIPSAPPPPPPADVPAL